MTNQPCNNGLNAETLASMVTTLESKLTLTVEIKNVYGSEKIYPICNIAKGFASLLNQTTLTRADITKIKSLGYQINVSTPKHNL